MRQTLDVSYYASCLEYINHDLRKTLMLVRLFGTAFFTKWFFRQGIPVNSPKLGVSNYIDMKA